MAKPKYFRKKMSDVEAGAYYTAAEALLIGLKHIKEHNMSYPIDMTPDEWQKTVDELIWFLHKCTDDKFLEEDEIERFKKGSELLGKHFVNIWC